MSGPGAGGGGGFCPGTRTLSTATEVGIRSGTWMRALRMCTVPPAARWPRARPCTVRSASSRAVSRSLASGRALRAVTVHVDRQIAAPARRRCRARRWCPGRRGRKAGDPHRVAAGLQISACDIGEMHALGEILHLAARPAAPCRPARGAASVPVDGGVQRGLAAHPPAAGQQDRIQQRQIDRAGARAGRAPPAAPAAPAPVTARLVSRPGGQPRIDPRRARRPASHWR